MKEIRFMRHQVQSTACRLSANIFSLSVCHVMTFESLDVGSSFSLIRYIYVEYGPASYMKVTRSSDQSQGHRSKKCRKSLFPQLCKTLIGASITVIRGVCMQHGCMVFSDMVDRIV